MLATLEFNFTDSHTISYVPYDRDEQTGDEWEIYDHRAEQVLARDKKGFLCIPDRKFLHILPQESVGKAQEKKPHLQQFRKGTRVEFLYKGKWRPAYVRDFKFNPNAKKPILVEWDLGPSKKCEPIWWRREKVRPIPKVDPFPSPSSTQTKKKMTKVELPLSEELDTVQEVDPVAEPRSPRSKQKEPKRDPKTNWVLDAERSNCQSCEREFTWYWRKHHCRQCGDIFCSDCCPNPWFSARACKPSCLDRGVT